MLKIKKYIVIYLTSICLFLVANNIAYALEMAITVDDLPAHGTLPPNVTRMDVVNNMLRVFEKHHITGVYGFINADKIEKNRNNMAVLSAWIAHGQLLGNHTFSHLDLTKVSAGAYLTDIQKNEPYLISLMKNKRYQYFRYPFLAEGNTQEKRDAVRRYLFSHQYKIAEVTTDFFDYEWNDPYARCLRQHDTVSIQWLKTSYLEQAINALQVSHQLSELLFHRDIKNILLIHIGAFDATMLDSLLTAYEKQGVKFISLDGALQDNVYKINPNVIRDRTYTFLNQIRISKRLQNPIQVEKIYTNLPEDKLNNLCRDHP